VDILEQEEALRGGSADRAASQPLSFVTLEEHQRAARQLLARGSERTSAKTGLNVLEAFMRLVLQVHEHAKQAKGAGYDSASSLDVLRQGVQLDESSEREPQPCACAVPVPPPPSPGARRPE
jgi:hypothetical protein